MRLCTIEICTKLTTLESALGQKQTYAVQLGMSALGQKRTSAISLDEDCLFDGIYQFARRKRLAQAGNASDPKSLLSNSLIIQCSHEYDWI